MEEARDKPIAACSANEVEAWEYPFWILPARGLEPPFIFLEDHLYNLEWEDRGLLDELARIDSEEDLRKLGFAPDAEGIFRI